MATGEAKLERFMFFIENAKNGKVVKDMITRHRKEFASEDLARKFADSMEFHAARDASAWNSTRRTKFLVVEALL